MVSASGESTLPRAAMVSFDSSRRLACSSARRRTKSSTAILRLRCVSQSSPSSTFSISSQVRGIAAVALPVRAEVAVVEAAHLRRQPRRHMDAVGDVADGHCVLWSAGIEALPHGARDLAVERGDGVGAARELQAEHGHAELLAVVVGIFAAVAPSARHGTDQAVRAGAPSAPRSGRH